MWSASHRPMFGHLGPGWWCYFGKLWKLYMVGLGERNSSLGSMSLMAYLAMSLNASQMPRSGAPPSFTPMTVDVSTWMGSRDHELNSQKPYVKTKFSFL